MPLRPESLPRDIDRLVALVVELSAENDQLRDLVKKANGLLFGARSERGTSILGDQASLDLGDLSTDVAAPANDDEPAAEESRTRKRARRNIALCPGIFRGSTGSLSPIRRIAPAVQARFTASARMRPKPSTGFLLRCASFAPFVRNMPAAIVRPGSSRRPRRGGLSKAA